MNILCLGDVVGENGCTALRNHLSSIKKMYDISLTVVNGENSAVGNGILPQSAEHIFASGADVITTGNHVFRRREIFDRLESDEFLIRPANYPEKAPGKGVCYVDMGRTMVAVINLMGVVYLDALANPYETAEGCIEKAKEQGAKIIIVDFHAEATGEKKAMGYFLNGKASVMFGTHTHVQTNDLQIFENGLGYITDIGMCGPKNSVLGVKPELAIAKQKDHLPVRFENAVGESIINGCVFEVDDKTGVTKSATLINLTV